MEDHYKITSFCSIRDQTVYKDGEEYYTNTEAATVKDFAKGVYKHLALNYAKFYKMDDLCKLSFLASEVLSQGIEFPEDTALVLANHASSLDTDRKYQESITNREEYYPSPALFVYTLPNIVIGELSIRYQLKSEGVFFVSESFDADFILQYASILLETQKASQVICGWVDLDSHKYDVFLALISKTGNREANAAELNTIYSKL